MAATVAVSQAGTVVLTIHIMANTTQAAAVAVGDGSFGNSVADEVSKSSVLEAAGVTATSFQTGELARTIPSFCSPLSKPGFLIS